MGLRISTAPHVRSANSTRSLMTDVMIALTPCVLFAAYRFGVYTTLLLAITMVTAVLCELGWQKLLKKPVQIRDGSAMLSGLLVGLNLPPYAPWWMAVIGSALAILLVKQLFGGIGQNFMNPALTARAILLASWPAHMASAAFTAPTNSLAFVTDAVSSATPLITGNVGYWDLFIGQIPGTMGEISKLAILLGFAYLLFRRVISWHIPVVMVAATALMSLVFGQDPLYAVLSGGLLFGAVFMATDYSTNPMTRAGQIIFAACAGIIVAVIRRYGAYPEGVTYGILIMNIVTPLLDKYIRPTLFGKQKGETSNG